MPVIGGVCSFSETDYFVHVSLGDAFAAERWKTLESVLAELTGQLLQLKSQAILLDLSAVSNTNSAVVTAVLRVWKAMIANGGRLVVVAPSKESRFTLNRAGLVGLLPIAGDTADAMHQLGVSRKARLTRRETRLLKWITPPAAAAGVLALVTTLQSLSPMAFRPSMLLILVLSAAIASGGGWLAAVRDIGPFRNLSRLVSATGVATLMTAIGHWTI